MNSLSLSPPFQGIVLEAFALWVLSVAVGLNLNVKLIFNALSGKIISALGFPRSVSEQDTHLLTFKQLPEEVE